MSDNSTAAQRSRIHAYLRQHSRLTTLQAREELDVMHPAARVMELRRRGVNIITSRRLGETAQGHAHLIAEYVLLPDDGGRANV